MTTTTASWAQLVREAPQLAARVRACFGVRKHCTLATLRRDGTPRISGTEVQLGDEHFEIGSMAGAVKAADLLRDGRCAVHSPTVDPPEKEPTAWAGEAKVAGVAVEVPREPDETHPGSHRFQLRLTEVVHTTVDGDQLVITSWHPSRGVRERRRS